MGSFRFRRTIKLAPGVRLNVNKRSVGISAGVRGVRASVNTDGQSTRSAGIPGTGLYYRSQTRPRRQRGRTRARPHHGLFTFLVLAAILFAVSRVAFFVALGIGLAFGVLVALRR
jgi:hypothetical protein